MPASIDIQPASLRDEAEIVPLMVAFNAAEHIVFRPETMLPALRELLQRPDVGLVLLARDAASQACLGYALIAYGYDIEFSGPDAFVNELFVAPNARSRGVGCALLDAVVAELRGRGARAVHLMVRPENERARALYERFGFQVVPRLVMSKSLVSDA